METFQCVKCGFEYKGRPGPHNRCGKCGCLYVKWTSYNPKNYEKK